MPYIIMARDDIPAGLLQTLDLSPHTSIREEAYQPVGQTGYQRNYVVGYITMAAGVVTATSPGLEAWLADNISSGAGDAATAAITTDTVANLLDGETFTISDGENTVTFEFMKTAGFLVDLANVEVDISADVTADNVRDTIIAAVNASALNVTATNGGASTVTLTNDNQNQPLAAQNNTDNAETSVSVTFAITDFAGATASDALTATEAGVNADDIQALVQAGTALTHTAINAALTTGAVNAEDVSDILDILAGRVYSVPVGTVIENGGAFVGGGGAFDDTNGGIRRIYDTTELRVSFGEGRLSKMVSSSFSYGGVAGRAVSVYNDDGSVYTAS